MSIIWTDEIDKLARAMRLNHTVAEIAKTIGVSRATCYSRLNGKRYTPEHRTKVNEQYRANFPSRDEAETVDPRPSSDMLADRDARCALPSRGLTGFLMGDPPVGLSALEERR